MSGWTDWAHAAQQNSGSSGHQYSLHSVFQCPTLTEDHSLCCCAELPRVTLCHSTSSYCFLKMSRTYRSRMNGALHATHTTLPLAKWPIYLSSFPQPIFFLLWVSLTRNLGSSKVTVENLGWLSFCCSSFSAAFLYVSEEIFIFF